jgi:hypothetical protein
MTVAQSFVSYDWQHAVHCDKMNEMKFYHNWFLYEVYFAQKRCNDKVRIFKFKYNPHIHPSHHNCILL